MTLSEWINSIRWKYFTNEKAGLIFKELMKEFRMVEQMTEKRYDAHKKVTLMEITGAFISYTSTVDLTRSEYLLVQNVFDVVMEKLNKEGDVE